VEANCGRKKMKILIIFMVLAAALAQNAVEVGDYYEEISSFLRVTGGTKAKNRIVPSFVALQIYFDHGTRTCGGFLGPAADQIVTAANCVFE
jgi:secreted trypsin-like serine protease